MTTIGFKLTVAPPDSVTSTTFSTSRQQQAIDQTTLSPPPSAGWVTRLGVMARATAGTPKISLALWTKNLSSGLPDVLLARTDPFTVGVTMQNWEAPIAWVNPTIGGSTQGALRVTAGQQCFWGLTISAAAGGTIAIGLQTGSVTRTWFRKDSASGIPLNPFGAITDGQFTTFLFGIYGEHTASTAPTLAATAPLAGAFVATATPTFEANFADADLALGDTLSTYAITVRNKATLATVWTQTFSASATEAADNHLSRLYGGSTLIAGTEYEWSVSGTDSTGQVSAATPYRSFTVASVAVVDVSTTAVPTGKVDGDSAQISFQARWWHNANLAADTVQVRILDNAQSAVVKEGPETAKSIAAAASAPGTAFTVSPTEAGIGALPYGTSFYWQIRARGTDGLWSAYSTPVGFRTNAIPSTPVLVSPANGAFTTALPVLVVASTDADADDVPLTGVVWDFEITQVLTGQIRTALAGGYDPATGRAAFQTTSTQVPAEGPYSWRARARDVSAGSVGITPYSAAQIFNFGAGPVVTITSPTVGAAVDTATPRIAWTSNDTQTAFQVTIYNVNPNGTRGSLVTSTPKVLSAVLFFDVTPGLLLNNTQYELVVSSWDDGDFQGSSAPRRFTVAFFVLQVLTNVSGQVVAVAGDVEPTTPLIRWDPTTYPTIMSATGQFTAYIVKRWEVGAGRAATEVTLVEVTNALQTIFYDYHAPPGKSLQYAVFQRVSRQNGGVIDSAEVLVDPLTVTLLTPVITVVSDPGTLRFPVKWLGANLSMPKKRRRSTYQTWGADGVPSVAEAPGSQNLRDFTFTILGDRDGSLDAHIDAIEAVADAAGPICWRDSRRRFFMSISSFTPKRNASVGKIDISMQLEQIAYIEGV